MEQKENLIKKLAANAEKLVQLQRKKENIESEIVRLEKKISMQKATLQILEAKNS
jgi:phage shock protein A